MSSSIFFRFKSQKDPSQISFDGTSLSVFEVKREIMSIARLGDGKDFDLDIYSTDSNEIYDDDTTQIPRSTTVIVRRQPAQRPGAGRAARYVTGQMPLHARNQHRIESNMKTVGKVSAATNGSVGDGNAMTEEEKLQAVLNASSSQMAADLRNSSSKPIHKSFKPAAAPDKPLPPGYMCHRCGKAGHWIQACPTNNDPNYDGKHKFKRTTGIPKSFHVAVDVDHAIGEDGVVDPTKLGKGVMYTGDGTWVRAKTDEAAWQKFQDQQKANAEKAKEAAQGDQELRDRGLECPIDKRPFADPVKTSCCGKTYCRDCIENALLDSDLTCPSCGKQQLLDNLDTDDEKATQLAEFEDERKADKLRKDKEASKSPAAGSPIADRDKSPSVIHEANVDRTIATVSSSPQNTKKRSADEELENNRWPSNPAEASKPESKQDTPTAPSSQSSVAPQHPPQAPRAPKTMNDFVNQMNSMTGTMAGMQSNMNAFVNPMMGMGMGMPGPMGMPMMQGMMPGFNPMMGGFPNMTMNAMGMNGGWQNQQQQQQPWMRNAGTPNNTDGGAYFRQPVNPHRHQGKQKRPRSVDYKQM